MDRPISATDGGGNMLPQTSLESVLFAQRKKQLRARKPGRCTLARLRLKAVFNRRKYYHVVMGLTATEMLFVLVRLILEVESLRVPPGPIRKSLISTELAFTCVSTFILTLFVLEQPFKWWALGSKKCWRSLLLVVDAVICFTCFALNVYTIIMLSGRSGSKLATARMLDLCGSTDHTKPPDTQATFVLVSGIIIVYRLWCIAPYVNKCVQKAVKINNQRISALKYALDEAEHHTNQLEAALREKNVTTSVSNSQEQPMRYQTQRVSRGNSRSSGTMSSSQRGNFRQSSRPLNI